MACVHVRSWAEHGDFSVSEKQISLKDKFICKSVQFANELVLVNVGRKCLHVCQHASTQDFLLSGFPTTLKNPHRKTKRIVNPSVIPHPAPRPHSEQFALARFSHGGKKHQGIKLQSSAGMREKRIKLVLETVPVTNKLFNWTLIFKHVSEVYQSCFTVQH